MLLSHCPWLLKRHLTSLRIWVWLGQSTGAAFLFLGDKLITQELETQLRKSCKTRKPPHQIKPTALQDTCWATEKKNPQKK